MLAELRARTSEKLSESRQKSVECGTRLKKRRYQQLEALEGERDNAQSELDQSRGSLQAFHGTLANIADAEDALEAAERQRERVERLGDTLDLAIEFLKKAQDKVYRTIAPVLQTTLLQWLPQVTDGWYDDCRIDPKILRVDVRSECFGEPWRDAGLLSHGTTEQIYLLLRLALSRLLGDQDESCPLILDDPVASSDTSRKLAVLSTLHAISKSVQVILFTHEDDVRDWARERLSGNACHRVIELAVVGT